MCKQLQNKQQDTEGEKTPLSDCHQHGHDHFSTPLRAPMQDDR
jgi:hypothetical protein